MPTFTLERSGVKNQFSDLPTWARKELILKSMKSLGVTVANIADRLNNKYPVARIHASLLINDKEVDPIHLEILNSVILYGTTISVNTSVIVSIPGINDQDKK